MHKFYKILKQQNQNHQMVILEEEYGFRQWFWFTKMTGIELESWWKRQNSIYKLDFISKFPGILLEACLEKHQSKYEYIKIFETDLFKNKQWFYDYYSYDWLFTKWNILNNTPSKYYKAHVFCDDDSWLISPKGNIIHHKGYYPARKQTELNIKQQIEEIPNG